MDDLPSYPKSLPLALSGSYSIRPQENIQRTQMESGPARQTRIFTQTLDEISVKFLFSNNEFAVFESWYLYDAQEGAAFFNILLKSGIGFIEHQARFTAQYSAAAISSSHWEITANLEIREKPVLDRDLLLLFQDNRPDDFIRVLELFNHSIHKNLSQLGS